MDTLVHVHAMPRKKQTPPPQPLDTEAPLSGGRRRIRAKKLKAPLWIYLTAEEKDNIRFVASMNGLSDSTWAANVLMEAVNEQLRMYNKIATDVQEKSLEILKLVRSGKTPAWLTRELKKMLDRQK